MLRGAARGCLPRRIRASSAKEISVKRLLLDLNIVLDIVLDRAEAASAARLWAALERGKGRGTSRLMEVTTIFYLVSRAQAPLSLDARPTEFCAPLRWHRLTRRFCGEPCPLAGRRLRGRRLRIRGGILRLRRHRDPRSQRIRRIASSNRRLPGRARLADRRLRSKTPFGSFCISRSLSNPSRDSTFRSFRLSAPAQPGRA